MLRQNIKDIPWYFYSKCIIIGYLFLQALHWPLFPLYMDIHYHLLTAWGFIKSGGYTGWDFWQYAPYGRQHIYPPIFHLILAFFMKLGMDKIVLAKCLEVILPVLFMWVAWYFIKRNYSKQLGFFFLIALGSSFSLHLSLINHLPATVALIFGILSLDQLFKKRLLRSSLLLTLGFYTHIGVPGFFAVAFILFAFLNREYKKISIICVLVTIALSTPIFLKQLMSLKYVTVIDLKEKYFCEFKTADYILAVIGFILSYKASGKYRIFPALFLSSIVFLKYPYRLFSAEGYLSIIFLSAISLDGLYQRLLENKKRYVGYLLIAIMVFLSLFSPTVLTKKDNNIPEVSFNIYIFDSVILNMLFPDRNKRFNSSTLWFPDIYLPASALIRQNSEADDIIYCKLANVNVALAGISNRVSANGLFPEIGPLHKFDPISVSKIFVAPKSDDPQELKYIVNKYNLVKIGEDNLFVIYSNPYPYGKANIRKASVSFGMILLIGVVFLFCTSVPIFWKY